MTKLILRSNSRTIRYTEAEDQVILKHLSKNPTNFAHAFKEASKELKGRSPASCTFRWYGFLKNGENIVACASRTGVVTVNRRVTRIKETTVDELKTEILKSLIVKLNREQKKQIINFILDLN